MHAGASDAAHLALGQANSADVLWVQSEYQGYIYNFSAIRIDDYFAITVGHATYLQGVGIITPLELGTGTNFLTNPRTVRTISAVTVHPAYPRFRSLLPARYYDSQIF